MQLTLEEMDILFGSRGVAEKDKQRMQDINREIGLEQLLKTVGMGGNVGVLSSEGDSSSDSDEKKVVRGQEIEEVK